MAVSRSPWTNAPQRLTEHPWVRLMEVSPEGRYLALRGFGRWGHRLVVCDLESGTRKEMPFRGCANHEASSAAWSANGKFLAVVGCGEWPCVYDAVTWKPLLLWRVPSDAQYGSGGPCGRLAFTEDGMLLANFGEGILHGLKLPIPPEALDWDVPGGK